MSAPNLGQFLVAINGFIQVRNQAQFTDYLVLEPPFGPQYQQMIAELKQIFPKGSEEALERKCEQSLPQAVEGADQASWSAFVRFMACYLAYLRDVDSDPNKYLETYDFLSELQKHANAALGHGSLGYLMLQTTIKTAKLVCRLAIGLDKRPDLIRHLKSSEGASMGDGDEGQETLPERAANSLRGAFNTCLADRSTAVGGLKDGRPEGKKQGIYIFANLCLKILFQCKKTRNAANLFEQIENSAPPLAAYPKSQRVTYLYYLGRYWFQNNHFYRAQAALGKAYQESPCIPVCTKQRRHVLVYLIASNIVLGRFPSQALLAQPEAAGLSDYFLPLYLSIRQGNLDLFKRHMYHNSANVEWMLYWRILLQLRSKCEVLVWRSLVRKTFTLTGRQPDPASKIAPTVDVDAIVAAYTALLQANPIDKAPFDNPPDPDFDLEDVREEDGILLPNSYTVESILSSLIAQGFLGGYVSHKQSKFAITGAARKGVMAAGFPHPWDVIGRKAGGPDSDHVPGWKKESPFAAGGTSGGPRVIRMSSAKAAGT
ncbi:hypothetical protein K431DRAFT_319714 [Polychaeton citri CBS 116435]|uniref:PCI domain-containing protein n=1 Tax=Polychaeton citri CBS 116435 TaxID=1314669 RepID=A0A9P4QA96_9PEZI|nr:hypothetical protein K431DRAFT_319714 [Polychaeton citri CBS 116435]